MGLYRRGKIFWFRFNYQGRRIQQSTGTHDRRLAERIYAKAYTEAIEGNWFRLESKKRSFDELRERYIEDYAIPNKAPNTVEKDKYSFKRLSAFFGGMMLAEITPQKIAHYKRSRREANASVSTIARELELMRASFNVAFREWEWLDSNPFSKVRIEKPRGHKERWITFEEEQRLLEVSPKWLREVIVFALNTGMRQGEILGLKWPQVDLQRKALTLLLTKNKEKRTIPLNQAVMDLLRVKSKVRHISGYVFHSKTGSRLDKDNVIRGFTIARGKADLDDVRFHDLRHTFATRLVQNGIELYVVSKLLGHKSIKMTMRYAHHYPESLRHGVDILDRLQEASTAVCYKSATFSADAEKDTNACHPKVLDFKGK
jgi:integrase